MRSSSSGTAPTTTWCCTASFDPVDGRVRVDEEEIIVTVPAADATEDVVARGRDDHDDGERPVGPDITRATAWMRWIERAEGRQDDEGGAGAYDTLRCDVRVARDEDGRRSAEGTSSTVVWGRDFHLDRLERSYRSLLQRRVSTETDEFSSSTTTDGRLERARRQSCQLLEVLLERAAHAEIGRDTTKGIHENEDDDENENDVIVRLVRVTWLWSPSSGPDGATVVVRGHAVASSRLMRIHADVPPITCTVAVVDDSHRHHDHHDDGDHHKRKITVDASLPHRLSHPQAKIAAWTRQRQRLEDPHAYKPPGVEEVVLVRRRVATTTTTDQQRHQQQHDDHDDDDDGSTSIELLEGLSSNLFVLYRDGTLRTPHDGVLHGYVRHLVLAAAPRCGLRVDASRPILLSERDEWEEAFITSSSRLIYPISKLALVNHDDGGDDDEPVCEDYWRWQPSPHDKPKWQELLEDILSLFY